MPQLDLASLQAKLVGQRRGGWCFEQNHLFRAVLRRLGYVVDGLEGRVRIGVTAGSADTARSHMVLRVTLDDVAWLVDVGLGGPSPLAPMAQGDRREQRVNGEPYRIVDSRNGDEPALTLQGLTDGEWRDIYLVHTRVASPIDYDVANWYVATNPTAALKTNLIVSRPRRDGTRFGLRNDRLTTRRPDGTSEVRMLASRAEIADALADLFGLDIADADLTAVTAVVERATGVA